MTTKPFPFEYDHGAPLAFGGAMPVTRSFDESKAVIFPVPLDRTTSYVSGTRNGPREILQASSHMELWDEELGADIHSVGIFTLPEMELPFGELAPVDGGNSARSPPRSSSRDKFLVTLGGEHSITPPLVAAAAGAGIPGCRCCRSTRTRICATATWGRRTITPARCAAAWNTRG